MERNFKLTCKPVEDTLTVKEKDGRFIAYYLTYDNCPEPPENDDDLFLVHYHRDCYVTYSPVVSREEARQWWHGEKIPQEKQYWIFPLTSFIHGEVYFYLGNHFNPTGMAYGELDTSHCGAVFVSKAVWKRKKKAYEVANGLVEKWNCYLTGDIYGVIVEEFDTQGKHIKRDECFGFYGYKYAMEELEAMMK